MRYDPEHIARMRKARDGRPSGWELLVALAVIVLLILAAMGLVMLLGGQGSGEPYSPLAW